ncbi:hypothetical protein L210DRAFT_3502060 [Boletus edulis BED1]|uniref:Uncharacterized protein n=1 Tax=Boletus edulis BED1 TaxID=1328754 RepID=A0AAD4BZE1_BOLED|nr:hypothetical protein L210DRAFT_3502060 [Boletus edulis BED1]
MKLPRNVHLSLHVTSVEYIYDMDDNDNEPAKVIYSCVWVEVLWCYHAEDVRAEEQSFADHMGKYELAESDHVSIVNVTCIEWLGHVNVRRFAERDLSNRSIASDELYIQWKIAVKVRGRAGCDTSLESARVMSQRNQLPALVKNKTTYSIELDQAFLALLRTLVAHGGIHGTSGNGMIMCSADAALQFTLLRGHLEENWNQLLDVEDAWPMEYPHCTSMSNPSLLIFPDLVDSVEFKSQSTDNSVLLP